MLSYISVVSTGYVLLISICLMVKAEKLHSITSSAILANFQKYYFKVARICLLFAKLSKNSVDFSVLEISTVDTVSRF